jgi:hypothetical protein
LRMMGQMYGDFNGNEDLGLYRKDGVVPGI